MMKTWSILFCLILQGGAFRAPAPIAPRARVDGGVIEGSYFDARSSDAVFKGIPFSCLEGYCSSYSGCFWKWGLTMVANVALAVGLLVLFGVAGVIFVLRTSEPNDSEDKS